VLEGGWAHCTWQWGEKKAAGGFSKGCGRGAGCISRRQVSEQQKRLPCICSKVFNHHPPLASTLVALITHAYCNSVSHLAAARYEEDVLINNHTAVWGSWWADGVWGYACCHSTVKTSYCTGKAGEVAAAAATQQMVANLEAKAAEKAADAEAEYQRRAVSTLSNAHLEKGDLWGSEAAAAGGANGATLDPEKVKAALKKLEQRERELEEAAAAAGGSGSGHEVANGGGTAERKRGYNSLAGENDSGVTPEEMEAYRIKKQRSDDPMAAFKRNGGGNGQYDLLE
jgi:pre-mRNA-processing factor SLU7